MATTLYVHVPFCVVKCGYCDFVSYEIDDSGPIDVYLDALARELQQRDVPEAPSSVFLGGGTPTYLDEQRLARLFETLGRHVDLAGCPEVTMEANPESVTPAKAELARSSGVNRVSLGAQTFDPDRLRFLDRAHSGEQTAAAVAVMRRAGFHNLSLDLMFGLPGQSLSDCDADLRRALGLSPDHLSCYGLTFEPGTRLHRDRARGAVAANDPDHDRELFLHTRRTLRGAGFTPYEISNFDGGGGPCRHNDHYWLQGNYVGVGPGAASHRDGVRSTNLKSVEAWADALRRGLPASAEAETLTPRQRWREALWLGIRRTAGIDLEGISARLRAPVPGDLPHALERLAAGGLVHFEDGRLVLTESGLLLADTVGAELLAV